jgi:hypothetical protein
VDAGALTANVDFALEPEDGLCASSATQLKAFRSLR